MIDNTSTWDREAWAFTDLDGRIETISSGARKLFGATNLGRGDDLLRCFPLPRKALLFDIEVALTGWPTDRTVVIRPMSSRASTIRYRVCRRLQERIMGAGLFWRLEVDHADDNALYE